MNARSTTYLPGRDVAVVRDEAWALLPQAAADAALPLWEAWAAVPSVTATIDVLAGRYGLDLATLPAFAAVTLSGSGEAHVLVRGDFRVRCVRGAGAQDAEDLVVDGTDASTWQERRAVGVSAIVVSRAGDVVEDGARWPFRDGVLAASLLSVTTGDTLRDRAPAATSASAPAPSAPAPSAPAPSAPAPSAPAPSAPVGEAFRVETLLPGSETIADPAADDARWDDAPPFVGTGAGADVDADADGDAAAVAAVPGAELGAASPEPEPDGYAHLWGETVARSVEDAAVRLAEDGSVVEPVTQAEPAEDLGADGPGTDGPGPEGSGAGGSTTDDAPAAEPVAAPAAPAPVTAAPALIEGVPWSWQSPSPGTPGTTGAPGVGVASSSAQSEGLPQPPVSPVTPAGAEPGAAALADDDHDGHTVMGEQVAVLRAQAAQAAPALAGPEMAAPAGGDGPQVLARTCPAGHVNPPARDTCRECGAGIEGDAATATRPSLGRVVVSDGPTLGLDRPLVVGRRPRSPRAGASDMPRLVTVPSPQNDISRSHAAVALEGWHVLVSDLATTNGTVLLRQGQAPRRLHPDEPTLLVDGDVVDLGDGVTLTFEGLW